MNIYNHPQFIEFEKIISEAVKKEVNVLIVSLPGMGATFFVKKFLEKNKKANYIFESHQSVTGFNILDLDFSKNDNALSIADSYIKEAKINQKFAVVINSPDILDSHEFRKSTLGNHIYKTFYMKPMDLDRAKILVSDTSSNIKISDLKEILAYTGGVARLVRYFVLNPEKIGFSLDDLTNETTFKSLFNSTIESMKKCPKEILVSLGLVRQGKYTGLIFEKYFSKNPKPEKIEILVSNEGSIIENGSHSTNVLLKHEKEIVEKTLSGENLITKDQISEIRWGGRSYDKYSDQAIKKIIQRINKKISKYIFVSVPTIGYRLQAK